MSSNHLQNQDSADRLLDRAVDQIHAAEPDPQVVAEASSRVWANLVKQGSRRGITVVKDGETDNVASFAERKERRASGGPRWGLWALAALLVVGIGVAQFLVREMWPQGPSATVVTVDGQLFRVSSSSQVPIEAGDTIAEHEVVRTGREGGAVVRLADGSLVELRERTEMAIDDARSGTTLELERGSVIVEAAQQREKHLYVDTEDCLVSVTGTIFSVNHGTKGSRVSVIEGEVHVNQGGEETVLRPGDQVATHAFLGHVAVADEIQWSRSVDDYIRMLEEYSEIRREIAEIVTTDLRYSTRLLDLMPEGTVFFAAAPNLTETLTATQQVIDQHIAESPELAEWWAGESAGQFQAELGEVITTFGEFGSFLGEELAVGGSVSDSGQDAGELRSVVVLADVVDSAGLRDFIERQMDEHDTSGEMREHVVFVDDPSAITAAGHDEVLYLWLRDGLAVASPKAEEIGRVASILGGAGNPFVGTDFHADVAGLYDDGVDFVVAADLATILDTVHGEGDESAGDGARLEALGVANARHLLLEQKRASGKTHHAASITFDGPRQGFASWLAAPAPMAALDFVSPDAKLVVAAVFKDPVAMLDEIYELALAEGPDGLSGLSEFEEEHNLSLRDDVAASLGGEMVLALDGPIAPIPAWKVIVEVYDPARFQWAVEEALAEANTHLVADGHEPLAIQTSEMSGHTVYTLPHEMMDVHYVFVEGYLVMAGDKAYIDQALRFESSGYSILHSKRFSALLPPDGHNNLSALVYQDLAGLMGPIAEKLANGQVTDAQRAELDAMAANAEPTLGYAYGEVDQITFAASSEGDMVTSLLMRLLGAKNPAGAESIFDMILGG